MHRHDMFGLLRCIRDGADLGLTLLDPGDTQHSACDTVGLVAEYSLVSLGAHTSVSSAVPTMEPPGIVLLSLYSKDNGEYL